VCPVISHIASLTWSTPPVLSEVKVNRIIPIGAPSNAPLKRASLSLALSRTPSLRRHAATEATPAATTKPPWISAHFHG
jgi:hypothetical protein